MAVHVIDVFEMIKIDVEQRHAPVGDSGMIQRGSQPGLKRIAVREARQRIVVGQEADPVLRRALVAQVADRQHRFRPIIGQRAGADFDRDWQFAFGAGQGAFAAVAAGIEEACIDRLADQLVRFDADEPCIGGVNVDDLAMRGDDNPFKGAICKTAQPLNRAFAGLPVNQCCAEAGSDHDQHR